MSIANIMSSKLITVSPTTTVEVMQTLLDANPIHHLLVVDDGKLVGVVSDRDILKIISPYLKTQLETNKDLFTLTRTAKQLMAQNLVTISPKASIRAAARCLVENKVSLLPVVNDEGEAIGVVSWKDVLRFIME